MPCTQDVTYPAFDTCDHTSSINKVIGPATDSPNLQRKRFQMGSDTKYNMTAAKKASTDNSGNATVTPKDIYDKHTSSQQPQQQQEQMQEKSSMIPLTKNEAQPQRVPGNHSPLGKREF